MVCCEIFLLLKDTVKFKNAYIPWMMMIVMVVVVVVVVVVVMR
jgi:hypothetical protein